VHGCKFTGWSYSVVLDGTEDFILEQCTFENDGYGVSPSLRGIWLAQATRGFSATGSLGRLAFRDNTFNDPRVGIYADGGFSTYICNNELNLGNWFCDLTGINTCEISDNYVEGVFIAQNITNAVNSGGLIKLTVANHGYATGDFVKCLNVGGTTEANAAA